MKALALTVALLLPAAGFAEELPPGIFVLDQGEPAPFPGVLLNEERAMDYARLKIRVAEQDLQLEVREREITRLNEPESWFERNEFFLGMAGGIVLSVALAYGAVRVSQELR